MFARGSKLAYICFVLIICAVVYIYYGKETELEDSKREFIQCTKQQEQLYTKLEDAVAMKLRWEKMAEEERLKAEISEKLHEALKHEQFKDHIEYEELQKRFARFRDKTASEDGIKDDKMMSLRAELTATKLALVSSGQELEKVKTELKSCLESKNGLESKKSTADPSNNMLANKMEIPQMPISNNGSTTPVINPDAIVHEDGKQMAPPVAAPKILKEEEKNSQMGVGAEPPVDNDGENKAGELDDIDQNAKKEKENVIEAAVRDGNHAGEEVDRDGVPIQNLENNPMVLAPPNNYKNQDEGSKKENAKGNEGQKLIPKNMKDDYGGGGVNANNYNDPEDEDEDFPAMVQEDSMAKKIVKEL